MHQLAEFRHSRAMHGRVIDDSTNFPGRFFRLFYSPYFSEFSEQNYTKFEEDIG